MKIVFVQSDHESLAVGIFSSLLKARGHEVHMVYDTRLFDNMEVSNRFLNRVFNIKEHLIDEVVSHRPDLVAFSIMTDEYQWALDMARRIKERISAPIIFGGLHPTMCPEEVISRPEVDYICVGEGEEAFIEFVETCRASIIKNIWSKYTRNECRPIIQDLDSLPFPDKKIFYDKQPSITGGYGVLTGRGCPFACTFCASDVLNRISGKGYLRRRSADNVIEEILHAQKTVGFKIKVVSFWDDTFTYDLVWLASFLALYKEKINLPFLCTGYPIGLTVQKIIMLKYAGCIQLGVGVQSVSERIRKEILHRPGNNQQIKEIAEACRNVKLTLWFDHILNIPEETEEDQCEALEFYNENRPSVINVFWLVYYPRTKIIDIAQLDDKAIEQINKGEASTAMVGQIGGHYSWGSRDFRDYAFLFHLLPLLPKRLMRFVIKHRMFLGTEPPLFVNVIVKILVRFKIGQAWQSTWFIAITLKRMVENTKIKIQGGIK